MVILGRRQVQGLLRWTWTIDQYPRVGRRAMSWIIVLPMVVKTCAFSAAGWVVDPSNVPDRSEIPLRAKHLAFVAMNRIPPMLWELLSQQLEDIGSRGVCVLMIKLKDNRAGGTTSRFWDSSQPPSRRRSGGYWFSIGTSTDCRHRSSSSA